MGLKLPAKQYIQYILPNEIILKPQQFCMRRGETILVELQYFDNSRSRDSNQIMLNDSSGWKIESWFEPLKQHFVIYQIKRLQKIQYVMWIVCKDVVTHTFNKAVEWTVSCDFRKPDWMRIVARDVFIDLFMNTISPLKFERTVQDK